MMQNCLVAETMTLTTSSMAVVNPRYALILSLQTQSINICRTTYIFSLHLQQQRGQWHQCLSSSSLHAVILVLQTRHQHRQRQLQQVTHGVGPAQHTTTHHNVTQQKTDQARTW